MLEKHIKSSPKKKKLFPRPQSGSLKPTEDREMAVKHRHDPFVYMPAVNQEMVKKSC